MKQSTSRQPLSVLIVEDSVDDAELLILHLRQHGYVIESERVETQEALDDMLNRKRFDVVITDHDLPELTSFDTLRTVQAFDADLPVIIVSGAIGEENAVAAMRAGAQDYVLKNNLTRLDAAIARELRNTQERRARRRAEAAVQRLQSRDALTDLLNRREFEKRLARVIETARTHGGEHALIYLDLDQFKLVNDTFGHEAGDQLLLHLAPVLYDNVRRRDTIARLGSDEFGILLEYCPLEDAVRIGQSLCNGVDKLAFQWNGEHVPMRASAGLAPIDEQARDVADVLSAADLACYAAKEEGGGRVHVFTTDDADLMRRHAEMRWVPRLHRAIERDSFELFAQPIVPVIDGTAGPRRFEVLLRMQAEDGEILAPGAFLRAAERYFLATRLDRWVTTRALAWLGARPPADDIRINLNLSGQSLGDASFARFLIDALERSDVAPSTLCFEVTETAAISSLSGAIGFMRSLRAKGCQFALDDFGSGLASFGYLKMLPIDHLKIDGSFVRDAAANDIDLAMVRSINEIGHVLDKSTVAEFVESESVLNVLREVGVDFAQGYFIGEPSTIDGVS